jgi:hypothetical protein
MKLSQEAIDYLIDLGYTFPLMGEEIERAQELADGFQAGFEAGRRSAERRTKDVL